MMCVLFLTERSDMDHLQGFHRFEWLQFDTNHGSLPDRRILATHEQMLNDQIYVGCNSLAQDDQRVSVFCFSSFQGRHVSTYVFAEVIKYQPEANLQV